MIPDKSPIYSYQHSMRSRYSETDKMGYVYYARYLEYFEVARTEMIRAAGIPYKELEERGILLPVVESHINYKAPIYYDDEINITVHLYDIPTVRLQTYYQMYTNESEKLRAEGKVSLCFVDAENRKPCRAPELFTDRLRASMQS